MGIFFTFILIGISLSMDAFSLALIYGTYNLSRKQMITLSMIVGIYHFFMPLIGLGLGSVLAKYFVFYPHLVVGIIFGIIGMEMFWSSFREEDVKIMVNFLGFLLFGLSVSIDSLTTGIGLSAISHNYLVVASIFMVISGLFTYCGLWMGGILNERFGKYATMVGGAMMIILAITYLF